MNTIERTEALREISQHEQGNASKKLFSIKFVTKKGEVVYYPHAYETAIRSELQGKRYIGIMPSSPTGQSIGHATPVSIDNILEYNHKIVTV